MNEQPAYLPRPGDLPVKELLREASLAVSPGGMFAGGTVYFKFTCMWCGARCTFSEPNKLYENGTCSECGKDTKVDLGGFIVRMRIGGTERGGSHEG